MTLEPLMMTPVREVAMSARLAPEQQPPAEPVKSFGQFLSDAFHEVDRLQKTSDKMNAALAAGQVEDVSQVILASQKAEIALQLTLQLRNRAISATQELLRMQV